VRRVGVEEAAAVGAELFDGDLAGDGAARDQLRAALDRGDLGEAVEVLNDALADEDQGEHEARRQQDPGRGAGEVDPEVAERMNAAKIAMPAAADTKLWTASPSIWLRWLIVVSPP
jgi:hypothetical protein